MTDGSGREPSVTAGGVVVVEPSGTRLEVAPGETVFEAATRLGYRWPTICGGAGTCRTCILTVLAGGEHASAIDAWEAEGLAEAGTGPGGSDRRMACQLRVAGGQMRVRKPGVRPA